ncbi:DJ-1/PfpI family protein [Acidaminobacter hydrogenoformans]|uniref:Putative intracellular protease/amidase n=1 Tax=Acidaminobacter hydrogenoformans DSM 2784 TaxID=1120920 RepID=A0A1G5RQD3_9FIRM|nr:DJ-1/PfpI family protein [Acidaminobacter hydrogenoformans]SCZ76186.1 Putative intracellular protease/amidase [Acidaminobacter hydrogenoformans DSM 2784]
MSDLSPDTKFSESRTEDASAKKSQSTTKGKVLAVVSSARSLTMSDGTSVSCGYHLCELADLHRALTEAGYQVVFATPDGDTPLADEDGASALEPEQRRAYELYIDSLTELLIPLKLSDITEEMLLHLHGLLIPGGKGALSDLPNHKDMKRILKHMKAHMKPIVAIGHGTAGLIQEPEPDEAWLFYDYEMTCFPKALEERLAKRQATAAPAFDLEGVLDDLGAELRFHRHYSREFIVEFKELLTGQNSASVASLAKLVICHLNRNLKTRKEMNL